MPGDGRSQWGRTREYIDFAVGGALRPQHLISDLLTYARIGQSDRVATDVDLAALVAEVARGFDAFFRGHPSRRYEGVGIGLAICRKVAEHHGESIAASSAAGSGTTITIERPGA